jgi:integrase
MPKTDHRKNLTPTLITGLKKARKDERYQVMDAQVPGFGVRVTDKGHKTFILRIRYPGSSTPSRREIGNCADITLTAAREKARSWRSLVARGIDPAVEEEKERQERLRQQAFTFAAVVDDFIRQKLSGERRGQSVEREIRRDLLPTWAGKPIASITDTDVITIVRSKLARKRPGAHDGQNAARNLLALLKRFFRWVIAQRTYGLTTSPCEGLRVLETIGEMKGARDRTLTDDEIFAFWRAASRMPYPHGHVYRVLILTGLRLNEAADASWPEFKHDGIWVIPAERMKGKNAGKKQARAHAVPITDALAAVLKDIPRFNGGTYLFSTTNGESAVWIGSKIKERLDRRMSLTLRALARMRGDDPASVELPPFVNHDIRRTVRSRLSRLKVTEEAREAVLAHARPGIKGVYDLHDYLDEKREALELWAARLKAIVAPAPDNIVQLSAMAGRNERA